MTREFRGRLWSVPARVYAEPLELYAGAAVSADELEQELKRLHYQPGDPATGPGLYRRRGGEFDVHARRVRFVDELRAPVRFGVRAADDPRIAETVHAIDAVLRTGVGWRRYPNDSYGEHADGAAWDGDGIGRSWPLLVGERGHYELARGNVEMAELLCGTMARLAGPTGMLPEQTWDAPDLPDRGLWFGQPTHSAAPLGWAHAEYLKLCRSLAEGRVFDLPVVSLPRARRPRAAASPPW